MPARGDSRGRSRWWRLPARSRRAMEPPLAPPPPSLAVLLLLALALLGSAGGRRDGTGRDATGRDGRAGGGEGTGREGNGGEGKRGEKRGKGALGLREGAVAAVLVAVPVSRLLPRGSGAVAEARSPAAGGAGLCSPPAGGGLPRFGSLLHLAAGRRPAGAIFFFFLSLLSLLY